MIISFASGKGGAGKTFLATHCFDYFLKNKINAVLADFDVEEPNSRLFFQKGKCNAQDAHAYVPEFIKENCTECNECVGLCKFNAFTKLPGSAIIFKQMCHDCGLCYYACKFGAIVRVKSKIGQVKSYQYENSTIIEGLLDIGVEQATELIRQVKVTANKTNADIIIRDAAPGTSCSFVETITDTDLTFLSIEDSPMGIHDGEIAIATLREMNKEFYLIMNKDINSDFSQDFREKYKSEIIASIPEKVEIAKAYAEKDLCPEDKDIKNAMKQILLKVEEKRGQTK